MIRDARIRRYTYSRFVQVVQVQVQVLRVLKHKTSTRPDAGVTTPGSPGVLDGPDVAKSRLEFIPGAGVNSRCIVKSIA